MRPHCDRLPRSEEASARRLVAAQAAHDPGDVSLDRARECGDALLGQPWILRWCTCIAAAGPSRGRAGGCSAALVSWDRLLLASLRCCAAIAAQRPRLAALWRALLWLGRSRSGLAVTGRSGRGGARGAGGAMRTGGTGGVRGPLGRGGTEGSGGATGAVGMWGVGVEKEFGGVQDVESDRPHRRTGGGVALSVLQALIGRRGRLRHCRCTGRGGGWRRRRVRRRRRQSCGRRQWRQGRQRCRGRRGRIDRGGA